MKKIIIYDKNTKKGNFNNYGLGVLNKVKSCKVVQELNGRYDVELEVYLDDEKVKYLKKWNIIRVDGQLFRITFDKIIDSENIIIIKAMHIFYDLEFGFVEDSRCEMKPMLEALTKGIPNEYKDVFTCNSDITDIMSLYHVEDNGVTCIFNAIERWGKGELLRDNFHFEVNNQIGKDTGVIFTYRKIEGIEIIGEHENVATRIYPKGYDGITLPEKYIEIPNWNSEEYLDVHITKLVKFENAENEVDLRLSAQEYVQSVGLSVSNITIKLHDIKDTNVYKELENLHEASIGDIVTIKHSKLNIRTKVKIISITKDIVNGNTEIELGQPLGDFISSVDNNKVSFDESKIISQMTKFQQGMYYFSNVDDINVVPNEIKSLGYVKMALSESNNLMGYVTLNCISEGEGTANFTLLIDNMPSNFKPIQRIITGNNIITFTFPLLMLQAGQSHSLDVKIESNCQITTKAEQFQLIVYGQFLEGGMSADFPHIEAIEQEIKYNKVIYSNSIMRDRLIDVKLEDIPPLEANGEINFSYLNSQNNITDKTVITLEEVTL